MSAEITMWVEVEVITKVWRETYGVVDADALENAELAVGERLTGRVRYGSEAPELTGGNDE